MGLDGWGEPEPLLIAKMLLKASYGLLWAHQNDTPYWQKAIAVIQYCYGTGWEADDRKGLGCHYLRVVAFAVLATFFLFKN